MRTEGTVLAGSTSFTMVGNHKDPRTLQKSSAQISATRITVARPTVAAREAGKVETNFQPLYIKVAKEKRTKCVCYKCL